MMVSSYEGNHSWIFLARIAAGAIVILFFVVPAVVDYFDDDALGLMSLYWAVIGLVVGYTMEAICANLAAEGHRVSLKLQLEQLEFKFRDAFNVKLLPSPEDWLSASEGLARQAVRVENTFVTISDSFQTSDRVIGIYNNILSRPGTSWTDIVSRNSIFSSRYLNLNHETGWKGVHRIHLIRDSFPIANFTIFHLPNGRATALFGWSETKERGQSQVFLTENQDLCRMFGNLFKTIIAERGVGIIEVDCQGSDQSKSFRTGRNAIINRKGCWYTQAYDKLGAIKRVAVFKIDFTGGKPYIKGWAANSDGTSGLESINHGTEDTHTSGGKIYAEYESKGFVVYDFDRVDNHDVIKGYFVDQTVNSEIVDLYGVRVLTNINTGSRDCVKNATSIYGARVAELRKMASLPAPDDERP